jgi:uroporphyrinogen-III decarboxylase
MEWLMAHRRVSFDPAVYEDACRVIGERGAPSVYIPRINLMRLYIEFMGFEHGVEALYEMPKETAHLLHAINESDEALLDMLCACPIEIINFGDNVHQAMCPPPLFREFVMPQYQRRNERLRAAGKKTYPHWDGDCGQLLPYARDCGFEGIEAITPLPQGDVTLEQVRDALGDRILLDGIPCTDFLFGTHIESLLENTHKCIEYFHPHLVLGISDEISPVGDIERVRKVSEIVAEYNRNSVEE